MNPRTKDIFARGSVKIGDNRLSNVGFAFDQDSGKTLMVLNCRVTALSIPPAPDQAEALWLLQNHPKARHIDAEEV